MRLTKRLQYCSTDFFHFSVIVASGDRDSVTARQKSEGLTVSQSPITFGEDLLTGSQFCFQFFFLHIFETRTTWFRPVLASLRLHKRKG